MSKRKNVPTSWTPRLIKQLRGNRSLAGFATLVGATRNTVWRWGTRAESAQCNLLDAAIHDRPTRAFPQGLEAVGSMTLLGDLEGAPSCNR